MGASDIPLLSNHLNVFPLDTQVSRVHTLPSLCMISLASTSHLICKTLNSSTSDRQVLCDNLCHSDADNQQLNLTSLIKVNTRQHCCCCQTVRARVELNTQGSKQYG